MKIFSLPANYSGVFVGSMYVPVCPKELWIRHCQQNYDKKVPGNNLDFLASEFTSKKVRGNYVDFLTIEITSIKVRGNDVEFSISEITSKKYVETRRNHMEFRQNLVFDVLT